MMSYLKQIMDWRKLWQLKGLIYKFAIYISLYYLSEMLLLDTFQAVLGREAVTMIYVGMSFSLAMGFLLFPLSWRIFKKRITRKILLIMSKIIYFCMMAAILYGGSCLVAFSNLSMLLLGYVGGSIYYYLSMELQEGTYTGRVLGIALSLAVFVQAGAHALAIEELALILVFFLGVLELKKVITYSHEQPESFEDPLPYSSISPIKWEIEVIVIAVVVIMSFVLGINGALLIGVGIDIHGFLCLSGENRIVYAAGLLIAGFVADYRQRKHLIVFTLAVLLISLLGAVISQQFGFTAVHLYTLEFYGGFYVIYTTIIFLDMAPKTSEPMLWANMGRLVRSIFIGITALPSLDLMKIVKKEELLLVNFIVVLLCWILLLRGLGRNESQVPTKNDAESDIDRFSQTYQLTPREKEVLEKVMSSEKTIKDIAVELYISERVLQRYLTSIYSKTKTKSRIGLCMLFYR